MRAFLLSVILTVSLLTGCSNEPVFNDTQGQSITLSQLRGKWVVVNYWAEWCRSCIKEIPELNHFNQAIAGKNIVLFGVNYDNLAEQDLNKAMLKSKINFPILTQNPNEAWHLGKLGFVPTTFIIDPQGEMVKAINGPASEKILFETLEKLKA